MLATRGPNRSNPASESAENVEGSAAELDVFVEPRKSQHKVPLALPTRTQQWPELRPHTAVPIERGLQRGLGPTEQGFGVLGDRYHGPAAQCESSGSEEFAESRCVHAEGDREEEPSDGPSAKRTLLAL